MKVEFVQFKKATDVPSPFRGRYLQENLGKTELFQQAKLEA